MAGVQVVAQQQVQPMQGQRAVAVLVPIQHPGSQLCMLSPTPSLSVPVGPQAAPVPMMVVPAAIRRLIRPRPSRRRAVPVVSRRP